MAGVSKALLFCSFSVLFLQSVVAPPPKGFFPAVDELSSSTQLSIDENGDQNSIWDEEDDVFDLDGDSWLRQSPPGQLNTWPSSSRLPKPSELDDGGEDNMIDDEEGDSDEEERDSDPSEFLLVPEMKSDDEKRDFQARRNERGEDSGSDISESSPDDDNGSPEKNESYDVDSNDKNEDFNVNSNEVDEDNIDSDLFGDRGEEDSKKLFEDRVFLF